MVETYVKHDLKVVGAGLVPACRQEDAATYIAAGHWRICIKQVLRGEGRL